MKLKYKYVVINNRLVQEDTAPIVMDQILGPCYSYTGITIDKPAEPLRSVVSLLVKAEEAGILHSFRTDQIVKMIEKLNRINGASDRDIQVIIFTGKKPLLYIGYEKFLR